VVRLFFKCGQNPTKNGESPDFKHYKNVRSELHHDACRTARIQLIDGMNAGGRPHLAGRPYPARQRIDDGPNADRVGTDYLFETLPITKNSKLTLKMANGGGFVIGIN
jgi:hypothetical protein